MFFRERHIVTEVAFARVTQPIARVRCAMCFGWRRHALPHHKWGGLTHMMGLWQAPGSRLSPCDTSWVSAPV